MSKKNENKKECLTDKKEIKKQDTKEPKKQVKLKQDLIISCFYNSANSNLPVGFDWAQTLLENYKIYNVTILLHGQNIPYGLNNKVYKKTYNLDNPYICFFQTLVKKNLKIVICNLCLNKDGFNDSQLLPFVKPIPFSISYIAESEKCGKTVIYDAKL